MEVKGKRAEKDDGGNVEEPGMVCEPCQVDNITAQAHGVCRECEEHMCNTCFKDHLKAKSCRQHVLVDEDVSLLPFAGKEACVVKCKRHDGETIKFFCRKHEVVGCGDCMVLEHNTCKSEYIKNLTKNFQHNEEYKSLMSKIEKLAAENKENETKVQGKQRDNEMMIEGALVDIRKFRIDINKYLDKVEADVISEAKHIMSENDKILTKLEQDCKLLSTKIDKIKKMLNTEVFNENELFINTVECKPNVSDVEKTIAEVKSTKTKTAKFVCDERHRYLSKKARKV